ncbi:MAG TPA: 3-deoxy-manno-octulosonate cytidylyltransferase [Thermoanaerobaculia bacterium]
MNALIVIPARYGSTRFPGKPLVMIGGQTLIERVHRRALESKVASAVWIATDDDRIVEHVRSFGGRVVKTESNLATGTDRIAAALDTIEKEQRVRSDQVINLQGDEPLIEIGGVDRLIRALQESKADVVTLSCPIRTEEEFRSHDIVKVVADYEGNALYFSRAAIPHDSYVIARRHVGVYGYQSAVLRRFPNLEPSPLEIAESLEQLRLLQNGYKIRVIETAAPHLGVDRPEDVAKIEDALAKQRP